MRRCYRRGLFALVLCLSGCQPSEDATDNESQRPISPKALPSPPEAASSAVRSEFERTAARLKAGTNPFIGEGYLEQLRIATTRRADPRQRMGAHGDYTVALLQFGRVEEALTEVGKAFALAEQVSGPDAFPNLYRVRGLVYLRQAELQNCVARHNADCCLFPLRGGGLHRDREPALRARADYEHFLKLVPKDNGVRWLLNIVNMALGEYPDGVPREHRLPPASLASETSLGQFRDIAGRLGIDCFNHCGGAIVEDFDGDDLLDIVTSTFDASGPMVYYRNVGDGTFADRSAASGLDQQLGGLNCIAADYNNDGHRDILVLRGAWLLDDGRIRNSLLRNNGDGTFTDVTVEAGIAEPACPTQAACWADFDQDGDLDLFIGNESRVTPDSRDGDYPSQLFRNNGDGTFTDIAARAGVTNDSYAKGVSAGDYDNDGDIDLYVSNVGHNRLYRNNGDGTFTDVARSLAVSEPSDRSFACWFWDYDNDGWLDLFVAAYDAGIADVYADHVSERHDGVSPCLYHNNGDGTFTEVAAQVGLAHPWLPMGANFGDLDNDGYLDVYLGTGDPDYQVLVPNVMLQNKAGKRFANVTTSVGLGHLQKGHGIAFADLDHDGDQDIYHQVGGFYPDDAFRNALFENPGNENQFVSVQLRGKHSNRDGLGARIRVLVEDPDGQRREIHRAVGSVSSFGGSPFRQEIGLGTAQKVVELAVTWPRSQLTDRYKNLPADRMLIVTEGAEKVEIRELVSMKF